MTSVTPLSTKDRDKMRGQRIKNIRTELKLTQVQFGKMVSGNQSIDRKTVYDWESGKFCPNTQTLKMISQLGRTTEEEILYGTIEEYVRGLILNKDSLIENNLTSSDISLFDYLNYTNRPITSQIFNEMKKEQEEVTVTTLKLINQNSISITDTPNISKLFTEAVDSLSQGDITSITSPILNNIELIESEWLPERLEENYYEQGSNYPSKAIYEVQIAIDNFKNDIKKINYLYSKFNNRSNTDV